MRYFLVIVAMLFSLKAMAQTNTTSSNTVTGTNTVTSKSPSTANAPSFSVMNQAVCSFGISGAIQTNIFGIAGAKSYRDLNCERLLLSRALQQLNLSVAAVAILAQDPRVHAAMMMAGTYPPIDSHIGIKAKELWEKYPKRAPGYDGKKQSYAQGEDITDEEIGVGLFSLGSLLWLLLL